MSSILTSRFGTFTPTVREGVNVAASTSLGGRFIRIGNIVLASCTVTIDPTASNVLTIWGVTLPIATTFSDISNCSGIAANNNPTAQPDSGTIRADITNHEALAIFEVTHSTNLTYIMTFMYTIA